ncbi:MAG TPA: membrane protein insertase YidC [Ohtaekwangia sp.]|uniref:membrane protein insertase YidC n=1 Tax=Ohtaekwangia sp. TaxID=2066019 RepID=UPI002F92B5E8
MDRNSAIGLTLIAVLLIGYFYWFSPQPQPVAPDTTTTHSTAPAKKDSLTATAPVVNDSALQVAYGDAAVAMKGIETPTVIETADLKITFSNKGGSIKELELKKYQSYQQKYRTKEHRPLKLVSPEFSEQKLLAQFQGRELDLYSLYYQVDQKQEGDTTVVTFTASLSNGSSIAHTYKIPKLGYEIGYAISSKGLDSQLTGDNLSFQWKYDAQPFEKDLTDTRNNTTITYYSDADGFNDLSPRSAGTQAEALANPVKWVAVKEKFFLASIIAKDNFAGGELQTSMNPVDSSVVKSTSVKLLIPKKSLAGTASFKFYFGPNDYKIIGDVAERFKDNVNLGWRPVYWINKFVIFPVFHFLTQHITNYGIIIIILVILLKLVLFPLSYRSYLSMAKMKVLKPELDEIKERVGDDMTKVQQEQMKLYQQVGVNPISGCVPVLLQMPILFAMFYLFPASIELRQQPFLWAEDLSTYDSLIQLPFTLPFGVGSHISLFTLIMTISTLIYTWQNNQLSSVQGPMKSMSYIMPVIFFFFLNSFSAGLTFYYFISNLVTFGQQAVIKRFVDESKIRAIMEENKKKNAAGGGKKSKFMTKLEEAMKAGEEARKRADEEKKRRKS